MFFFVKLIVRALALLPFAFLYLLSDLLFVVLYYLVRYRRGVVMENLQHAFPEKEKKELVGISWRFYRRFCDQIVETIKLFNASTAAINKRFEVDRKVYDDLFAEKRHVVQAMGHFFNWEWGNWALNLNSKFHVRIIYMIMRNKHAEPFINSFRKKAGSELISAKDLNGLLHEGEQPALTVFLADQNPAIKERAYWVSFFGRTIPFQKGMEMIARRKGHAVVFDRIERVKRGHYRSISKLACRDASVTAEGEITEAYVRFLEESIRAQPENWLWTHKRWKYAE